jgi:hypothetical protein
MASVTAESLQAKEAAGRFASYQVLGQRMRVHTLLDAFESEKLASSKMIESYRKAADADKTLVGLQGFYEWMAGQQEDALGRLSALDDRMDEGLRQKIMSRDDRAFLKKHIDDFMQGIKSGDQKDLIGEIETMEEWLGGKLSRMKKDRDAFTQLREHRLICNTGFLQVDAETKIDVPDVEGFLKLKVPERRKLIERIQESLSKAQVYSQKANTIEDLALHTTYKVKLATARQQKIIGRETARKFMAGFKVVDSAKKREWINEFDNQMQRYEQLWARIQSNLEGSALERMELKRDGMGWSELSSEYADALCDVYGDRLVDYEKQGAISEHTRQAFSKSIRRHSRLDDREYYLKTLDDQMDRYVDLRSKIDGMKNKKARVELQAMYTSGENGWMEISRRYAELSGDGSVPGASGDVFEERVRAVGLSSDNISRNIVWSVDMMNRNEAERMLETVDRVLRVTDEATYDARTHTKNVEAVRRKHQEKRVEEEEEAVAEDDTSGAVVDLSWARSVREAWHKKENASKKPSFWGKILPFRRRDEPSAPRVQSAVQERTEVRQLEREADPAMKVRSESLDAFNEITVKGKKEDDKVLRFGIADTDNKAARLALQHRVMDRDLEHVSFYAKHGDQKERLRHDGLREYRRAIKARLRLAS